MSTKVTTNSTASTSATIDALEKEYEALSAHRVFDITVRDGVSHLIDTMPIAENEKNVELRIRLLLLRCKTRLLLPYISKEAEKDCNAVIKLCPSSVEAWVQLSECLLRRNAFKDACEALESALKIDPHHVEALCKYSQIERNRCSEAGLAVIQKKELLQRSIARARSAVQFNVEDGEAWYTLSLALLSEITLSGMSVHGLRKALSAMQQAVRLAPHDPDVYYNRGVLFSLLGYFGSAAVDFAHAREIDSQRLKGARTSCQENYNVLERACARMKNANGIGKRDFKKMCAKNKATIEAGSKSSVNIGSGNNNNTMNGVGNSNSSDVKKPNTQYMHFTVVDVISDQGMQPLVLLAADMHEVFHLVLVYEISANIFKVGDLVSCIPREKITEVTETVPAIKLIDSSPLSLSIKYLYADNTTLMLNGKDVPQNAKVPVQFSSRLFA